MTDRIMNAYPCVAVFNDLWTSYALNVIRRHKNIPRANPNARNIALVLIPASPKYTNSRVYCRIGGTRYIIDRNTNADNEHRHMYHADFFLNIEAMTARMSAIIPAAAIATISQRLNHIKRRFIPRGSYILTQKTIPPAITPITDATAVSFLREKLRIIPRITANDAR